MNKKSILIICCFLADFCTVYAQQILSLRQCMQYAVASSTQRKIQETEISDARLQRRDAILKAFTPAVSAGSYLYSRFGRSVDPETNTYINTTSFNNGYSLNASLVLFDGFSAINNIQISKTAIKMGLSRAQQIQDELCLSVMESYYNVVFHQAMQKVIQKQVAVAQKNVLLLRKQYELGQKSLPDVAQTEADLAEKEYQLIQNENLSKDALLTLKALMLWPDTASFQVDTLLVTDSAAPEAYAGLLTDLSETTAATIGYAQQNLPSAQIARGELKNARLEVRTAKWQFLPTLSLDGGWSTNYYTYPGRDDYKAPSFGSQWHNNAGEYVQLSLTFPIYDRLFHSTNLSKKKNNWKRAQATYNQTLKDIEAEVHRAMQDRRGALSAYIQAEKRTLAQEKSYELNSKKMQQGLLSPVEYQTIANTYLNAKAEQLNALLQYHLKNSVVQYYKGTSYLEQYK